jgi:hypothetical protein
MKRVFLDTNILIDYIQARAGGDDAKQLLMRGLARGRAPGCAERLRSYRTFSVAFKQRTGQSVKDWIAEQESALQSNKSNSLT